MKVYRLNVFKQATKIPSFKVDQFSGFRSSSLAFSGNGSSNSAVKNFAVVGAGQMGIGIALVAARVAGIPSVQIVDSNPTALDNGHRFLNSLLEKDISKGKISREEADLVLSRVRKAKSLEELSKVDFVVEAVTENLNVKRAIFETLDKVSPPHAILATNTSSISITKIAAATQRPEKVIGMHFMNPVPVMKLVEIISGLATSQETLQKTLTLSQSMGKTTTTSQDTPGFIANRLLMPFINEAIFALQEGVATKEDIDTTMKLGTNHPMGPLTLADFIGLDTCLAIMNVLHSQIGDSKYRPATLLRTYVDAGWLGKKTGRGFYDYSKK
ncbi:hypothetical protein DSO57_1033541 [Entomophthora muscae]|uniref:Uncharacterized protein n=3 Tax=Entomophthora muscae TaxID=34485 RepID=A0ACC2T001_9FUNG|nr:hypothetical protein DSO57_1033541 [Entomophthora muscae]